MKIRIVPKKIFTRILLQIAFHWFPVYPPVVVWNVKPSSRLEKRLFLPFQTICCGDGCQTTALAIFWNDRWPTGTAPNLSIVSYISTKTIHALVTWNILSLTACANFKLDVWSSTWRKRSFESKDTLVYILWLQKRWDFNSLWNFHVIQLTLWRC